MKILVVDDDEIVRLFLRHILVEKFTCTVFEAKNGLEGLALVRKENPDLVFLDITMPMIDGREMLKRLRADVSYAELPVVILSAVNEKPSVIELIELGISDYFLKPLDLDTIVQRIEKVLSTIKPHPEKKRDEYGR